MMVKPIRPFRLYTLILMITGCLIPHPSSFGQAASLTDLSGSPWVQMQGIPLKDLTWTRGFWAERFAICRDSMVPFMWKIMDDETLSHAYRNFEIAAGLQTGVHQGPPFNDGDFFKWFESLAAIYMQTGDQQLEARMDSIIEVIEMAQRADGYIHTPVLIEARNHPESVAATEFRERLDFETYNMGHLMTAACLHYRATGNPALLQTAERAADYLAAYLRHNPASLAQNAICPSHYMGVLELYRTTGDTAYLELGRDLINIRSMVEEGTDHNQDRIPFRKQSEAKGHAVRANYLYAGVADLFAEIGDTTLWEPLNHIWQDLVQHKLYITGGCGALYDGVSPDGTSYNPAEIQQVHQAYGRAYQLPNITAHNESCAAVGNLLWNWRMLLITGEPRYAEIIERILYNSILSAVSLNGKAYFYANPLRVDYSLPDTLRWSREREPYIALSNCCPPNVVRTVAEAANYFYSVAEGELWFHLYGAGKLNTILPGGEKVGLIQETGYPWDGNVEITLTEVPDTEITFQFRIPSWAGGTSIRLNGETAASGLKGGHYFALSRRFSGEDKIQITFPMSVRLTEANPLVEETRGQLAVQRGPIVYCLESPDLPEGTRVSEVGIPVGIELEPQWIQIAGTRLMALSGKARLLGQSDWEHSLYRDMILRELPDMEVRLIPYFAWGNRGRSEMSVWLPKSY